MKTRRNNARVITIEEFKANKVKTLTRWNSRTD